MTATVDEITAAALEAEKTLPKPVEPRSGPLMIHSVALLDQDGEILMTQTLTTPVYGFSPGGAVCLPAITFMLT